MKLHLPKLLLTAVMGACSVAWGATISTSTQWTDAKNESFAEEIEVNNEATLSITGGAHTNTQKIGFAKGADGVMSGGSLTVNFLQLCNNSSALSEFTISDGTLTLTKSNTEGFGANELNASAIVIGHWGKNDEGGAGLLTVNGGTVNALDGYITVGFDVKGSLNINNDGVVNAKAVTLRKSSDSALTLNGGRLNIGASGIGANGRGNASAQLKLLSGTLGTYADSWTLNSTNVSTTVGKIKVDTSKWDTSTGASSQTGANISLLGTLNAADTGMEITLSGSGSLTINRTLAGAVKLEDGSTAKLVVSSLEDLTKEVLELDYTQQGVQEYGKVYHVFAAEGSTVNQVYIGSASGTAETVINGAISHMWDTYVVTDTTYVGGTTPSDGIAGADIFALADSGTLVIAGGLGDKPAGTVLSETIGTGIINVQCAAGAVSGLSSDFSGSLIVGSGGSMTLSCVLVNGLDGSLEVDGGSLTLNRGGQQLEKSISIKNNGILTVYESDLIKDTSTATVVISLDSSTMEVGRNRFTMGANHTIEMKSSDITGSGDAHGLIDISKSTSISSSGSSSIEGAIRIRDGAELSLNLTDTLTIGTIVHSGSLNIASTSSGTLKITSMVNKSENYHTGATSLGAGVTLDYAIDKNANDEALSGAYSGVISGEGKVLKSKAGVVTLSGANTYSGGTDINAGTLVAANTSALGTGKVVMNGGKLQQDGAALTVSAMDYKSGTVDNGGQNLTVEGTLNVEAKMEIAGTGATSIGTLNLALGLSSDSAAVTTSGALTLGSITLNLTDYAVGNYTLVSATGDGSISWNANAENAWSNTGTLGEGLEASVGLGSDNKTLQLTISEMVTPGESLITTSVSTEEGWYTLSPDGTTLTLTVDASLAGLAADGSVMVKLLTDEQLSAIMGDANYKNPYVLLKLTDSDENTVVADAFNKVVFVKGDTGKNYWGEMVGGQLMYNVERIPEPASATLSLAALMMLCARRRRRA